MLQIKTICDKDAKKYDEEVNAALREGWYMARRGMSPDGFFAELEREEITEAEQCCENCKHYAVAEYTQPCCDCSEEADKWEPIR